MDHHCVWLNMTIGYKNHRTFVVFLQLHMYLCLASILTLVRYKIYIFPTKIFLYKYNMYCFFVCLILIRALHREVPLTNACEVLSILLNGNYFFVIMLVGFLTFAALGLIALSFEQLMNIAKNIVSCYFHFFVLFYFIVCLLFLLL